MVFLIKNRASGPMPWPCQRELPNSMSEMLVNNHVENALVYKTRIKTVKESIFLPNTRKPKPLQSFGVKNPPQNWCPNQNPKIFAFLWFDNLNNLFSRNAPDIRRNDAPKKFWWPQKSEISLKRNVWIFFYFLTKFWFSGLGTSFNAGFSHQNFVRALVFWC